MNLSVTLFNVSFKILNLNFSSLYSQKFTPYTTTTTLEAQLNYFQNMLMQKPNIFKKFETILHQTSLNKIIVTQKVKQSIRFLSRTKAETLRKKISNGKKF